MDRFDDMRARVSGSGESGGEGGGGPFGVDVLVQATNNFDAGDTFVGTAVSGATPKMYNTESGLPSVGHISADGTVAIKSETLSAGSTIATLYVRKNNEDAYAEVVVNLPDMTGASSTSTGYNQGLTSINEDGTKIVINMVQFLLKIEVDKNNKTATASRIEITSVNLGDYRYVIGDKSYEVTPAKFQGRIAIIGSYLFFAMAGTYEKDGSVSSTYFGMYGRVTGSSISHEYRIVSARGTQSDAAINLYSGVNSFGGNDLIFVRVSGTTYRIEISTGNVESCNAISFSATYITRNGKYATSGTGLYRINQQTGAVTQIATFKSSLLGCDETGEYVFYSNKCYKASDTQFLTSLGEAYGKSYSTYYTIVDDSYIGTNSKKYTILPSAEAEYTIAHTTSVSTAGDIYGVVTDSMTMGETKKALKIFNK